MTWIHGRQDEVVPFEAVDRLASELDPSPLWIPVPEAGHDLPLSNAELLARAIAAALDRGLARSPDQLAAPLAGA